MSFRFEGLEIWQLARRFSARLDAAVASFPSHELYGLRSQLTRAANAVALLIAEGAGLPTRALFAHRLGLATGETFEVAAGIILASDRGYWSEETARPLYAMAATLARKIARFKKTLVRPGRSLNTTGTE